MRLIAATLSFLFVILLLSSAGLLWVFWTFGRDLPDYEQLANYEPPIVTRVHAGNGALLGEYAREKRLLCRSRRYHRSSLRHFCRLEDKAFYAHFGIDLRALARAVVTNVVNLGSGRRPVGTSTITQQVTKNFC